MDLAREHAMGRWTGTGSPEQTQTTCANLAWDKGAPPDPWVRMGSLFNEDVGATPGGTQTLTNTLNCITNEKYSHPKILWETVS